MAEREYCLMYNTYVPEKTYVHAVLKDSEKSIAQYLSSARENWAVLHYSDEDGSGLDTIENALNLAVCQSNKPKQFSYELDIKKQISDIQFLNGSEWFFMMRPSMEGRTIKEMELERGKSKNTMVGFTVNGIKMIHLRTEINTSPGSEGTQMGDFFILDNRSIRALKDYIIGFLSSTKRSYEVKTYDCDNSGDIMIDHAEGLPQSWDNLVLNDDVVNLVKRDIESFLRRKAWFLKNSLPFRRGYLFHGPPGNGKTSVIKTILSTSNMNVYKIRLFNKHLNDQTLEKMFEDAQKSGPNIVALEDIDRAFPKTGESGCPLGLHTLLNCLDGLTSQEGVITIATANEPTILDRAILKRPGRFDRVVLFDNPNPETREKYFRKKAPYLTVVGEVIEATEGFSFAQLQETYILAGQYAYDRNEEEIKEKDLIECASLLKGATINITGKSERKGF